MADPGRGKRATRAKRYGPGTTRHKAPPRGGTVIRATSSGKAPLVMLPHSLRRRAEAGSVRVASVSVDPCDRGKRLVTVRVDLGHRRETMTINVLVPNERDEREIR